MTKSMLLTSLRLAFEDMAETVKFISIIVIAALVIIIAAVSLFNRKTDTRSMVYAAICVSASFALSFIKFEFLYGGSITLASFVPLIIYAYVYGPVKGLLAGMVYGLLQFVQSPYYLTPVQFALDYILAFSSIAFAGMFKNAFKDKKTAIVTGIVVTGLSRLLMHTLAGVIYFNAGCIMEGLPTSSALLYSFCYNVLYVAPDILIAIGVIVYMIYSKAFDSIENIMVKPVNK